ncbi:TapY2 family type IVa secretion system protein [uncultured Shewanella sp.]|uniref:TapY2 family type IVa secretion system protein n=1 Tax=uncultured Shewanella sp. TaxID=173975 RepID=UPI0026151B97|nr:TapY2 family type IVa secretion system protein [uncultured Shewanella sp.]
MRDLIKNLPASFVFIMATSISTTALASEKQEYKCYVDTTDGAKVVFYRWQKHEFDIKFASLAGRQNVNNKGKKYFIKDAMECVTLNEEFSSSRAKKLDLQTLR